MSCATCHDPSHADAPARSLAAQLGGSDLRLQGVRAVPILTYLERTPRFAVRLDTAFDANAAQCRHAAGLLSQRSGPLS